MDDLAHGRVEPSEIMPLVDVRHAGKMRAMTGNRRLHALRWLHKNAPQSESTENKYENKRFEIYMFSES